jgi:hypothetical protein
MLALALALAFFLGLDGPYMVNQLPEPANERLVRWKIGDNPFCVIGSMFEGLVAHGGAAR